MNTEGKSMMLAKLMGWGIYGGRVTDEVGSDRIGFCEPCPYSDTQQGLAQFAAIMLRFPEVLARFKLMDSGEWMGGLIGGEPTQSNILDEILRMNGKEID